MSKRASLILIGIALTATSLVFLEAYWRGTKEAGAEVQQAKSDVEILKECIKDAHLIWNGEMARDDPEAILDLTIILFERRVKRGIENESN